MSEFLGTLTGTALFIWFFYGMDRAFNQRQRIIFFRDDLMENFDTVPWYRHTWHAMTFRDAHKLYENKGEENE